MKDAGNRLMPRYLTEDNVGFSIEVDQNQFFSGITAQK